MLEVDDISVGYGETEVLHNVSIKVNEGELVAIIGSNGAGKTTLMKTISSLIQPTRGEIRLAGERIDVFPPHEITRRGIVQVLEGRRLFVNMTVEANLHMGAYLRRSRTNAKENLNMVFELFPILKERKGQVAATLSGGEQQMLAIGRALMAEPKILLIDEFSLGLAPVLVQKIFEVITQLNSSRNLTIVLTEQNVRLALEAADRAYALENGKIVLEGSGLLDDEFVRKAYLGI